jgi:GPH family glycoside/pentoside/hexuronide:cation symporter
LFAGTYYVFPGDQAFMSLYYFYASIGYFVCGVLGVFAASWIAKRFGKHTALLFTLATGIFAFGSSWWMYRPGNGWMLVCNTALTGFSATGFWVVLPSMCVDVVDDDELRSGQRREGAFTSWFSWVTKLGMALSMGVTGYLLAATGFDAAAGGNQTPGSIWWIRFLFAAIPVVALLVVLALLAFYPLSRSRMRTIRLELEAKRGKV